MVFAIVQVRETLNVKRNTGILLVIVLYIKDMLLTGPNEMHVAEKSMYAPQGQTLCCVTSGKFYA